MKEFLNICYKFFNRFITGGELIEKLSNIKNKEINKIIKEIKNIIQTTPDEEDEYIKKEKQTIKKLIKRLENIPNKDEFINKQLEQLKKDYKRKRDSKERWFKITDYINNNEYFNECFENLSDYELLEFIAQYIQAPFPPNINQEEFEKIVKAGIEHDKREWLWRLAFNYNNKKINFDSIVDYFIKVKDGYYLTELISAVGENLDLDKIIDKVNDKELIEDLITRKDIIMHYFSEEQLNRIKEKLEGDL